MSSGLGWVKMNGKKTKVLGCGCCVAEDHREEILWKEAANEARMASVDPSLEDEGMFAYMEERDELDNIENSIDRMTYAKYTWGAGLSEPRIKAIEAQRHADYLARFADIYDSIHASPESILALINRLGRAA